MHHHGGGGGGRGGEEEEFFNHYKNDLKRHAHTLSGDAGDGYFFISFFTFYDAGVDPINKK